MAQPFHANQLLLGCPQQFCINGNIDTILNAANGMAYLFRGKYFWEYEMKDMSNVTLNVKNAKLTFVKNNFYLKNQNLI